MDDDNVGCLIWNLWELHNNFLERCSTPFSELHHLRPDSQLENIPSETHQPTWLMLFPWLDGPSMLITHLIWGGQLLNKLISNDKWHVPVSSVPHLWLDGQPFSIPIFDRVANHSVSHLWLNGQPHDNSTFDWMAYHLASPSLTEWPTI